MWCIISNVSLRRLRDVPGEALSPRTKSRNKTDGDRNPMHAVSYASVSAGRSRSVTSDCATKVRTVAPQVLGSNVTGLA
jgi:hypothetical protein